MSETEPIQLDKVVGKLAIDQREAIGIWQIDHSQRNGTTTIHCHCQDSADTQFHIFLSYDTDSGQPQNHAQLLIIVGTDITDPKVNLRGQRVSTGACRIGEPPVDPSFIQAKLLGLQQSVLE